MSHVTSPVKNNTNISSLHLASSLWLQGAAALNADSWCSFFYHPSHWNHRWGVWCNRCELKLKSSRRRNLKWFVFRHKRDEKSLTDFCASCRVTRSALIWCLKLGWCQFPRSATSCFSQSISLFYCPHADSDVVGGGQIVPEAAPGTLMTTGHRWQPTGLPPGENHTAGLDNMQLAHRAQADSPLTAECLTLCSGRAMKRSRIIKSDSFSSAEHR